MKPVIILSSSDYSDSYENDQIPVNLKRDLNTTDSESDDDNDSREKIVVKTFNPNKLRKKTTVPIHRKPKINQKIYNILIDKESSDSESYYSNNSYDEQDNDHEISPKTKIVTQNLSYQHKVNDRQIAPTNKRRFFRPRPNTRPNMRANIPIRKKINYRIFDNDEEESSEYSSEQYNSKQAKISKDTNEQTIKKEDMQNEEENAKKSEKNCQSEGEEANVKESESENINRDENEEDKKADKKENQSENKDNSEHVESKEGGENASANEDMNDQIAASISINEDTEKESSASISESENTNKEEEENEKTSKEDDENTDKDDEDICKDQNENKHKKEDENENKKESEKVSKDENENAGKEDEDINKEEENIKDNEKTSKEDDEKGNAKEAESASFAKSDDNGSLTSAAPSIAYRDELDASSSSSDCDVQVASPLAAADDESESNPAVVKVSSSSALPSVTYSVVRALESSLLTKHYSFAFYLDCDQKYCARVRARNTERQIPIFEGITVASHKKSASYTLLADAEFRSFSLRKGDKSGDEMMSLKVFIDSLMILPRHIDLQMVNSDGLPQMSFTTKNPKMSTRGHWVLDFGDRYTIPSERNMIFVAAKEKNGADLIIIRQISNDGIEIDMCTDMPEICIFAIGLCVFIGRIS